uniref:Uncharacterized protein n=1 Tax=viral metagenome TaxID=1070528 RepID=A0A6H1ZRM8_9ZZZZ
MKGLFIISLVFLLMIPIAMAPPVPYPIAIKITPAMINVEVKVEDITAGVSKTYYTNEYGEVILDGSEFSATPSGHTFKATVMMCQASSDCVREAILDTDIFFQFNLSSIGYICPAWTAAQCQSVHPCPSAGGGGCGGGVCLDWTKEECREEYPCLDWSESQCRASYPCTVEECEEVICPEDVTPYASCDECCPECPPIDYTWTGILAGIAIIALILGIGTDKISIFYKKKGKGKRYYWKKLTQDRYLTEVYKEEVEGK